MADNVPLSNALRTAPMFCAFEWSSMMAGYACYGELQLLGSYVVAQSISIDAFYSVFCPPTQNTLNKPPITMCFWVDVWSD